MEEIKEEVILIILQPLNSKEVEEVERVKEEAEVEVEEEDKDEEEEKIKKVDLLLQIIKQIGHVL